MGKKTLIILALLSLAWMWPPEWNPHGKTSTFRRGGNYTTVTNKRHSVIRKHYSDGYVVTYFFDTETTVRPVSIDPAIDCDCCLYLLDFGIVTEDLKRYLDPEDWKESDWQWFQVGEGCGKDLNGGLINIGF